MVTSSNKATIICPKCSVRETSSATKREAAYGTGGWGTFDEFQKFNVTIQRDQDGPFVESASCKECNVRADVVRKRY